MLFSQHAGISSGFCKCVENPVSRGAYVFAIGIECVHHSITVIVNVTRTADGMRGAVAAATYLEFADRGWSKTGRGFLRHM